MNEAIKCPLCDKEISQIDLEAEPARVLKDEEHQQVAHMLCGLKENHLRGDSQLWK